MMMRMGYGIYTGSTDRKIQLNGFRRVGAGAGYGGIMYMCLRGLDASGARYGAWQKTRKR
jgi:hypothetical protein